MKNQPLKKILFLLVFCLTSTLYVSGQTYGQTYQSSSDVYKGDIELTKTSATTWTLKIRDRDDIISNYYLVLDTGTTYKIKSMTSYVTIKDGSELLTLNVDCFNIEGKLLWTRILYAVL
jgi:hypothetical protein